MTRIVSRSYFTGVSDRYCRGVVVDFFRELRNGYVCRKGMVSFYRELYLSRYARFTRGFFYKGTYIGSFLSRFCKSKRARDDLSLFVTWVYVSKKFYRSILFASGQTTCSFCVGVRVLSRFTSSNRLLDVLLSRVYSIQNCGVRRLNCGYTRAFRVSEAYFSAGYLEWYVSACGYVKVVVRFEEFETRSRIYTGAFARFTITFRVS